MLPTRITKGPDASGLAVGMGLFFAGHFEYVLAVEFDAASADRMFTDTNRAPNVHPVAMDFLEPTPNRGWRLQERTSLDRRAPADFSTWLAALHHICLGWGFPLHEALATIAEVSSKSVIQKTK